MDKPLTDEQMDYVNMFAGTRRMKRDVQKLTAMFHGEHGLNGDYGVEGEFFVGGGGVRGSDRDASIIDYNKPAITQHDLWCWWIVQNNDTIVWNGVEKFYNYVEWIQYYITNFFGPWGVVLNG